MFSKHQCRNLPHRSQCLLLLPLIDRRLSTRTRRPDLLQQLKEVPTRQDRPPRILLRVEPLLHQCHRRLLWWTLRHRHRALRWYRQCHRPPGYWVARRRIPCWRSYSRSTFTIPKSLTWQPRTRVSLLLSRIRRTIFTARSSMRSGARPNTETSGWIPPSAKGTKTKSYLSSIHS